MSTRLSAIYHVRGDAAGIMERARAIAVEQSVEMPVSAIGDETVLAEIVGQVEEITALGQDWFAARIGLAVATTGHEAGQLLNVLFGNTSIHEDVLLHEVVLPADLVAAFTGPRQGMAGLRQRAGAAARAMTCSALKPQGLRPAALADLAYRLALGGLDFIKDDHGLADQRYSPFADRVAACAEAVRRANAQTGRQTCYLPNLSGDLDALRRQLALARAEDITAVLLAPLLVGLPAFQTLARENPDIAFMVHPALAGGARIAPPLLIGTLFRLLGGDALIFPNHGGRFGYSAAICRSLAANARADLHGLRPALPVPAGGMSVERVPEMLDFYGTDVLLLIGGALLAAGDGLTAATAAFTTAVREHTYRSGS
jgi:ribulose-bisphosphate carboxylase large chain